ncbi:winged helix-turn-helix transcriptional regulator [Afipia massiliensis]|uniref:winged helix-turn-helix transcriptional regulator n=1 Tax=Afipia massiliensis TaxID=211460 RepID=UPI000A497C45|nr:winged helix-turn-helix transcriptional regulator [Afipia massiliensis]
MRSLQSDQGDEDRIVLNLLNSVESDGSQSQRHLAAELGIALGLVNAYLKRCVRKGLLKVSQAPARRYAYYLTPNGFTEKSRLTVEYLSSSFAFFRQAKADFAKVFETAKNRNFQNIILCGKSDLAEVAILSAVESGISILAVIEEKSESSSFVGKRVISSSDEVDFPFDALVITDVRNARETYDVAVKLYGSHRVLAPQLLGLNKPTTRDVAR